MKRFISLMLAVVLIFSFAVSASARLVGDVDSSGKVNSTDALITLRHAVDNSIEINEKFADVNGDKIINSTDALIILKISVGTYNGDLEVDDELVTSYLTDVLHPIMGTGEYTIITELVIDGEATDATLMAKGDDICIEMVVEGKTARILLLDGKNYIVFPDFMSIPLLGSVGVYDEIDIDVDFSMTDSLTATYIKSEYVTVDGVEYICESYDISNGATSQYYFKDGKWTMYGTLKDGETSCQKIKSYKKGVNKSAFSLDGLTRVDLSGAM